MHDICPFLPQLFTEPGLLLYVGARVDACSWLQELHDAGNIIDVLEVWPQNVWNFKTDDRIGLIYCGDVRRADSLLGHYDYVFWWHGPEHIPQPEVALTLAKLEAKARRLVAVASPWGLYPQGEHEGNPHEQHLWSVYEEDLQALGYETKTDGEINQPGSEIVGWKVAE